MQNIGSKCLVVFEATVMEIIGAEGSPMLIVQDDKGARFKVGPECAHSSAVFSIKQGDTVNDQFTGDDLGAAMRAAEGEEL